MPPHQSTRTRAGFAAAALAMTIAGSTAASALTCGTGPGGFDGWLSQLRSHAAAQGISKRAIDAGLAGVTYDANVVRLDRSQHSFKLSFEQFYARRVGSALINRAQGKLNTHASLLSRIEQKYGVPGAILVSIWGLETNFGGDSSGKHAIIRSIATLAYDCRRSEFFQKQLLDALRILDRGDLSVSEMRGGWAGEIGHVQFLPSAYYRYAVDFDGDGRRDLVHSIPDMLASTANFLKGHGWQRGAGWQPGSANYAVLAEWNKAEVYQRTIAVMASKIAGRS